jgi:hypothetical protein
VKFNFVQFDAGRASTQGSIVVLSALLVSRRN